MKHSILRKLMLIAVLLTSSQAFAHDFEVDKMYFNIISSTDLTVEITRKNNINNSYYGNLNIPASVTYKNKQFKVEKIGDYAFVGCYDLKSVIIPNTVTVIGRESFLNCSNLKSITIPNSVKRIDPDCFNKCSSLDSITIPDSVEYIGYYAFYGCSSLTSITIPNSVTSIGSRTFDSCKKLKTITIGTGLQQLGAEMFKDCSSLTFINSLNEKAPSANTTFGAIVQMETTLRIPKGSLAS